MNWKALKETAKEVLLINLILPVIVGLILSTIGLGLHLLTGCGILISIALIFSIAVSSVMLFQYIELDQRSKE